MKFFDAHAHVQFSAYDEDRDGVIERASAAGVRLINVGTQIDTSRAAVELAEKYEDLYAAVGLHPVHTARSFHDEQELGGGEAAKAFTSRGEIFDPERYRALALHPKTVAIGECGLDYYHLGGAAKVAGTGAAGKENGDAENMGANGNDDRDSQIAKQKDAFIAQMRFAKEVGKPLMIHCRNAFHDLIDILRKDYEPADPLNPGVIHFFTGTEYDAKALLDMGFSFDFGGAITFKPRKGGAGPYDSLVKMIPIERIISETDSPYVAPEPYRGKRNEPAYVIEVVKKIAELKGLSLEETGGKIMENVKRVFGIVG